LPRPFVSVLIDTYNHEKFIGQAITSVLEQNYPASDYEVLVVDDGSTDCTPELVKKFAPRARDVVIEYVRALTYDEVTDHKKFEEIRKTVGERVTKALGKSMVKQVLFTDFVVQ
jgi:glycosyltransferase involved in cell wall biosynthesis